MFSLVMRVLGEALELVAPQGCPACGIEVGPRRPFCNACALRLVRNREVTLGEDLRLACAFRHEGPVVRAIHRLKYEDHPHLAVVLGSAWMREMESTFVHERADGLVPVPLHPTRLGLRGYNQSALFAKALGRLLPMRVRNTALCRVVATSAQVGQGRLGRAANVENAFLADPGVRGSRLWLVDDVVTTGATVRSCAAALRAEGAEVVGVVAIARAGQREHVEATRLIEPG